MISFHSPAVKHRLDDPEQLTNLKRRKEASPPPSRPNMTEEVHARVDRFLTEKALQIITSQQFLPLAQQYGMQPAVSVRILEEWLGSGYPGELKELLHAVVGRCFQSQPLIKNSATVAAAGQLAIQLLLVEPEKFHRVSQDFSLYQNYEMRRLYLA
jgi:hypothetical protein